MFIGHIALGLAAKRNAPRTSLGLLVGAPILADLLWPTFLLLGLEEVRIDPGNTAMTPFDFVSYPWSHSLLMLCVWGTLAGAVLYRRTGRRTDAILIALLVVSHWLLDFVTHRPDMPLFPWGGPKLGLSLWNHPAATVAVETAMFAAGTSIYFRVTRPRDAVGRWAAWTFVAFLAAVYFADRFSPPPPGPRALAWVAHVSWLIPLWAFWADRHRTAAGLPLPETRPAG